MVKAARRNGPSSVISTIVSTIVALFKCVVDLLKQVGNIHFGLELFFFTIGGTS